MYIVGGEDIIDVNIALTLIDDGVIIFRKWRTTNVHPGEEEKKK